jgi:DNA-binding transcriptional LysR family regulator
VTAAARALNITQPTASKLLADLEATVGVPLFNRVKGRLVPTREARLLAAEVALLVDSVAEFEAKAVWLRGGGRTDFHLLVSSEILDTLMPRALARLWTDHPDVTFHLTPTPEVADLDLLALVMTPPNRGGLQKRRVGRLPYRLVVPQGREANPWTLPQILPPMGTDRHAVVTDYFLTLGLSLERALTAPTLGAQMAYVQAGLGAAILPPFVLPGDLVALTPSPPPDAPVWLVGQDPKGGGPILDHLINALTEGA